MIEFRSKNAPIHIEFGSHGDENAGLLHPLEAKISENLQSTNSGRVIVYVEQADLIEPASQLVFAWVKNGMLPSDAFSAIRFVYKNERFGSYEELASWKEQYLASSGEFVRKELEILDNFHVMYPGRLWVVPEYSPTEELLKDGEDSSVDDRINRTLELMLKGEFDAAMPEYKTSVSDALSRMSQREHRMFSSLAASSINFEEDTTLVTTYLGAGHTRVYHSLKNFGLVVSRSFPEKEGKRDFFYPPFEAMVRRRHFFPLKIPSEEMWLKSLTGQAIFDVIRHMNKEVGDVLSEQDAIRLTYGFVSDLDTDKIREFEKNIREIGFFEALDRMVQERQ